MTPDKGSLSRGHVNPATIPSSEAAKASEKIVRVVSVTRQGKRSSDEGRQHFERSRPKALVAETNELVQAELSASRLQSRQMSGLFQRNIQ
jgi:hypothetical protein